MAMNVSQVESLIDNLGDNLDDLEASLAPLLKQALSSTTSRLPLLDKSKIYTLTTYAIESLLFSYLRLNGVDAKEHAVFRELTRVKAYFDKIKLAESGPAKRPTSLNKDAATRFVKHGLSGNGRLDREAMERQKRRAEEVEQTSQWGNANRFESSAKRLRMQETQAMVPVVRASEVDASDDSKGRSGSKEQNKAERKAARRQRRQEAALAKQSPMSDHHSVTVPSDQAESVLPPSAADAIANKVQIQKKEKKRKSRSEIRQGLEDKRAYEIS